MVAVDANASSNNSDDLPLPELRYLPLAAQEKRALCEFLKLVDTDTRITCYGDIAETLSDLLEAPPLHPATSRQWVRARKLIRKLHSCDKKLRRWIRPGLQPLSGSFDTYPVLGCLLYRPGDSHKAQIRILKRIVLTAVFRREAGAMIPSEVLRLAADEIRRASPSASDRASAIRYLPVPDESSPPLLPMVVAIQGQLTQMAKSGQAYRCLKAIQTLALAVLGSPDRPANARATQVPPEDLARVAGSVFIRDEIEPAEHSDEEPAEDVENITVFVEPESDPRAELSNRGFVASARASRYWLTRAQTGVLWDPGRINPTELPLLRSYLSGLARRVEAGDSRADVALATALLAATGLDLGAIARRSLGSNGDITPSGEYRRALPALANGFSPSGREDDNYLHGYTESLSFKLPKVVARLIELLATPERQTPVKLEAFFPEEGRARLSELIGKDLRNAVSQRLTYRHLRTALRHEIYSQTGDPLITYLIAGHTEQTSPVRLYYSAVPISRLQTLQNRAITRLFGDP
ncbi:MAG TPA: hypothetical protein VJS89_00910 [Gammaproteobacteria bacterium]|nr:hypothetical protein [Gammaproteobacteria bacterium]